MMKQQIIYKYIIAILLFIPIISSSSLLAHAENKGNGDIVYVIPVEKEVERGLSAFLKRTTNEAIDNHAKYIIFEIDTPDGRVDSAGEIGTIIQNIPIPTVSYVVNEALSAGSYIALQTDEIYMAPHARMGASGIITQDGNAAEKKAQSAWITAMRSAAESKDRDPIYAEAMANENIDLPEYGAPKGEFLTLSPSDAVKVGYAEGIVNSRDTLLEELGLEDAAIVEMETTIAEEIARFITSPIVIPILLSIASLGLIVELYSPGFGVAGTMGLIALVLFFYGHIIDGLAGMEAIILLVLGILLIISEFFVTGGILGLLGIGAVIGSLFLAGYDVGHMTLSIAIAFSLAVIVAIILFRSIGMQKGLFRRLVLEDSTSTDLGYVSAITREELIREQGVTITPLRPAGTILINHERIDAVSEGEFLTKDVPVEVVHVEGMRVVVRKVIQ